jgi:hypothetical protein
MERLEIVVVPMSEYTDPREFVHCIDRDGRISFVNDAWLAFAAENGWATTASRVLGSHLMQQIADPETRHIYQLLIDRVRGEGRQASFVYRCDSPDCRRLMEMRITQSAPDLVAFSSRVLHLDRRDSVNLLDPGFRTRSNDILTVCSWCKSVLADHVWIEVEQAVRRLEILTARALPQISHGICPSCSDHMTGVSEGL